MKSILQLYHGQYLVLLEMFSTLWPFTWSMISTTFLVTLDLCLSPFSSGGKRDFLPIRSAGSKVGIGFGSRWILLISGPDEDCRVFCFLRNLLMVPLVIQRNFIFRRVRRWKNLPSMWCKPMVVVEDFLGLIALLEIIFWVSWSKSLWVTASPLISPKPYQ